MCYSYTKSTISTPVINVIWLKGRDNLYQFSGIWELIIHTNLKNARKEGLDTLRHKLKLQTLFVFSSLEERKYNLISLFHSPKKINSLYSDTGRMQTHGWKRKTQSNMDIQGNSSAAIKKGPCMQNSCWLTEWHWMQTAVLWYISNCIKFTDQNLWD